MAVAQPCSGPSMNVPSTNVPSTNVRRACGVMAAEFHLATNAGSPRDGFLSLSAVISAGAAAGAASGAATCAASGAASAAGAASVGGAVSAAAAAAGAGRIAGAAGAAGADCSLECLGVWHERRAGRGVCHERRAGSSVSHESQQKRPAGPLWHGAAKKPCGVRSRLHAGTQSPPPHLMLYCCPAAAVTATAAAPTAATGAALTGAPTAANGPALTGAPTAAPTPTVTSTMTRSAAAAGTDGDAAWCRNPCRPGMVGAAQVKIRAPAQAPSQTRDSRTSCTAHPNVPQSSSSPRSSAVTSAHVRGCATWQSEPAIQGLQHAAVFPCSFGPEAGTDETTLSTSTHTPFPPFPLSVTHAAKDFHSPSFAGLLNSISPTWQHHVFSAPAASAVRRLKNDSLPPRLLGSKAQPPKSRVHAKKQQQEQQQQPWQRKLQSAAGGVCLVSLLRRDTCVLNSPYVGSHCTPQKRQEKRETFWLTTGDSPSVHMEGQPADLPGKLRSSENRREGFLEEEVDYDEELQDTASS